jgi:hypothetical protein
VYNWLCCDMKLELCLFCSMLPSSCTFFYSMERKTIWIPECFGQILKVKLLCSSQNFHLLHLSSANGKNIAVHAMKVYNASRDTDTYIPNLGTRWSWMINIRPTDFTHSVGGLMQRRTAGLDKKERLSTKFLYPCSNFFCIVKVGFFWDMTVQFDKCSRRRFFIVTTVLPMQISIS